MFVKDSWRTVKGVKYIYHHIAKSYRSPEGKPRHKCLANISFLPAKTIEQIRILLRNDHASVIENKSSFFQGGMLYGPIAFFLLFCKNVGVLKALKPVPLQSRILILAVILNRILNPKSKLASIDWIVRTALPMLFSLDKDHLHVNRIYQAMDVFYRRMDQVMERFDGQGARDAGKFILYDITSFYFEGEGPETAERGYSRDYRPDRPQILLGLGLNEQGFPLFFKMFEGNVPDKDTVLDVLEEVQKKYGIRQYVFVGDRGMVTSDNLKGIRGLGFGYIVALTHRKARPMLKDIDPHDLQLFDRRIPLELLRDDKKEEKYILCGSEYRREYDRKLFGRILAKGRDALEHVNQMVEKGRLKDRDKIIKRAQKKLTRSGADGYYDFDFQEGKLVIRENREKIEAAWKLCGYYILQTTEMDMNPTEVEKHYKQLQTVENAFRELKELIQIRPIYHWKERRVVTHVFLCILAQTILNQCRRVLKQSKWLYEKKENSVHSFLQILSGISAGEFILDDVREILVSNLTRQQKKLLRLFKIKESDFMDMKKVSSL